jgi:hypothetical protein
LGINAFRNTFRLALKLAKTCSNYRYWRTFEKQGNWFSRMFPALASSMAKTSKCIYFQNAFIPSPRNGASSDAHLQEKLVKLQQI